MEDKIGKAYSKTIKQILALSLLGSLLSLYIKISLIPILLTSSLSSVISTIAYRMTIPLFQKDPLYERVVHDIEADLVSPSKRAIKERFHIGDVRWRSIITMAEKEGYVRKVPINGIPTYIRSSRNEH